MIFVTKTHFQEDKRFGNHSKDMQLELVCLGQFVADCSYEVSDRSRWKKLRPD